MGVLLDHPRYWHKGLWLCGVVTKTFIFFVSGSFTGCRWKPIRSCLDVCSVMSEISASAFMSACMLVCACWRCVQFCVRACMYIYMKVNSIHHTCTHITHTPHMHTHYTHTTHAHTTHAHTLHTCAHTTHAHTLHTTHAHTCTHITHTHTTHAHTLHMCAHTTHAHTPPPTPTTTSTLMSLDTTIHLTVHQAGKFRESFIGYLNIFLGGFKLTNKPTSHWYKLGSKPGKPNTKLRGDILITVTFYSDWAPVHSEGSWAESRFRRTMSLRHSRQGGGADKEEEVPNGKEEGKGRGSLFGLSVRKKKPLGGAGEGNEFSSFKTAATTVTPTVPTTSSQASVSQPHAHIHPHTHAQIPLCNACS